MCGMSWAGLELAEPIHRWGSAVGRQKSTRPRRWQDGEEEAGHFADVPPYCLAMAPLSLYIRSLCLRACHTWVAVS